MSYIPLPVDPESHSVMMIEWEHARIHAGKGFTNTNRFTLNNNATAYHLLVNPAGNEPHIRTLLVSVTGAPVELYWLESPITTANGTATVSANNNRGSLITPQLQLYSGPTVTSEGQFLGFDIMTGSKSVGGAGTENAQREWILKPATNYLIKLVNTGAGNIVYGLKVFWYEE